MKQPHYKLLLPLALISCLSGCINHGEAQWITVRSSFSGQTREELVHVKMDAKVADRFTVWAMGGKSERPSEWVLPGALQTARKLGYRCLQVIDTYNKPLGAEMRDFNESWLTAQASMEPCTTDLAQKRYDLNLNIQKLEPKGSPMAENHTAKLDPEFEPAKKIPPVQAERPLPEKKETQSAASYPVLDMAAIARPAAGQASAAANLSEAVKRIEAQLAQYPEFQQASPKPRAAGAQILDALTFYPTEAPKPITKFETVDLPFYDKCHPSFTHFLNDEILICAVMASKKPVSNQEPAYYRLNFEINLKTGRVIPHPELSYGFLGMPAMGEIECLDPVGKYVQVRVKSRKPGEENIFLRGYWDGKIEAYRRDSLVVNKFTCKNMTNTINPVDVGVRYYGGFEYLRDEDGIILSLKSSIYSKNKIDRLMDDRGIARYFLYENGLPSTIYYLPFMQSYILRSRISDCIKEDGVLGNGPEFYTRGDGIKPWYVPKAKILLNGEHNCMDVHARPVKSGMVWLHDASEANKAKGINFQYWNKPEEVIQLAKGSGWPRITSPDGCLLIYSHFYKELRSRMGILNQNIQQIRITDFCNPRN